MIPKSVLERYEKQGYRHCGLGLMVNALGTRIRLRKNLRESKKRRREVWEAVLLDFDAMHPRETRYR